MAYANANGQIATMSPKIYKCNARDMVVSSVSARDQPGWNTDQDTVLGKDTMTFSNQSLYKCLLENLHVMLRRYLTID